MSKSIREQFIDFRIRHQLSLNTVREIVEDYASSDFNFARSHFCKKYELSEHVFYKCRDFAVILGLVSDKTCTALQVKASHNFSTHNDYESSRRTLQHFNKLLQQREMVLHSFTTEEKEEIGIKYSLGIPLAKIANSHGIGLYLAKRVIERGIIDSSIDDATWKGIFNNLSRDEKNKEYLDKLSVKRKKYQLRQEIWHFSNALKQSLSFIIINYDTYFIGTESPPSIAELKRLIEIANEKYEEASRL